LWRKKEDKRLIGKEISLKYDTHAIAGGYREIHPNLPEESGKVL